MNRNCVLILLVVFLFIPQIVYSSDIYAMGCKPAEEPKQEVPKATEEAPAKIPDQPVQGIKISPPPKPEKAPKKILKKAPKKVYRCETHQFKKVASFSSKKKAERLAKKLRKDTCIAEVRSITKNKKKLYGVFAKKYTERTKELLSSIDTKKDKKIIDKKIKEEKRVDTLIVKQEDSSKDFSLPVSPGDEIVSEQPLSQPSAQLPEQQTIPSETPPEKPEEQFRIELPGREVEQDTAPGKPYSEDILVGRKRPSWDVFGRKGGYLHPFVSVTEYYTDNIFNTHDDKNSDFVTILSPGIWITVPNIYEKLLTIDTSTIAPGGFTLSRYKTEIFKRYQTYVFYSSDIEKFSRYSSEDTVNHKAEGFLQYNFRGGLTIELVDQYIDSHDARGTGISQKLDKYKTNLANLILIYDASEKFRFRIDYSNYSVNYNASRNDFRDRFDNSFSAYIFYKFRSKTSFYTEYEFIDIDYDKEILSDSGEHHYYGGIEWDITAKSKGNVKLGYGVKDFEQSDIGESNDFIMEVQVDHKFTPKTSLTLKASRKTYETNISTTDFILSNSVEAEYVQKITAKITADIDIFYSQDTYEGDLTFGGETSERSDDFFRGTLALRYEFKEWMKADIGYISTRRDSNFSDFDYTNNTVFMRITGSL